MISNELNNEYIYIRRKAKKEDKREFDHYSVMDCKEVLTDYGIPILEENSSAVSE